MGKIKGNKTLSGTWGELWVDGERIAEFSKVSLKVTANREDVQIDLDVDSKMTGLKGELSVTLKKVYTRYNAVFENWKRASTSGCRSSPSWPTRTPWAASRSGIPLTTAGSMTCPLSTWRRGPSSRRRSAAASRPPTW